MICITCKEEYEEEDCGTCKECYEEASETEDELKREINHLKSIISFLKISYNSSIVSFKDVVLVASDDEFSPVPVPAHKSLLEVYEEEDCGTCKECYEEASETEDELKREMDHLKSNISFLKISYNSSIVSFKDVVLVASDDEFCPVPVPAHKSLLASRSPVFKAMLENEMEESLSGTIKISDVSYDSLRCFVNFLYTAEANIDEQMACNLLVLAEKYQVKHLKTFCEKFLVSRLNWDNSLLSYSFAHQHNAKALLDSSMSLIIENMDKLSTREEYIELVEKDPTLVVEIYEAYLSKQVNTAARKDSSTKS